MPFVALASIKGSPGVTTALAALATVWPSTRRLLVIEADPAGGDLAARLDLLAEPGLMSLAAAGRRDLSSDALLAHAQTLPVADRGEVASSRAAIVGPVSADRALAALGSLRRQLAVALNGLDDIDVIVDCGRLDLASPALDVFAAADVAVVLARPTVADAHHLAGRASALGRNDVFLVTIGDRPYTAEQLAAAVGLTPLGVLPHDPSGARAFEPDAPVRSRRRAALTRAATAMAAQLIELLDARNMPASPARPVARPPLAAPPPPTPRIPAAASTPPAVGQWPPPAVAQVPVGAPQSPAPPAAAPSPPPAAPPPPPAAAPSPPPPPAVAPPPPPPAAPRRPAVAPQPAPAAAPRPPAKARPAAPQPRPATPAAPAAAKPRRAARPAPPPPPVATHPTPPSERVP